MSPEYARMVFAALEQREAGVNIRVSSRSFWSRFGFPDLETRRDVQQRAQALYQANLELNAMQQMGELGSEPAPLAEVYGDLGYGPAGGAGGPVDTPQATIYLPVELERGTGIQYKSIKVYVPWDASGQEIEDEVSAALDELGARYGMRVIGAVWSGLQTY